MGVQFESLDQRHSAEWDELARETAAPPFHRPGWLVPWCAAFARRRQLQLVTVRRHGALTAVLPVLPHGSGLRSPTNGLTPRFGVTAATEADAEALVMSLLEAGPTRLELGSLWHLAGDAERLLRAAASAGYRSQLLPQASSPFIEVTGSWEDYEKRLSRSRRREIGRCQRRLQEQGDVVVERRDGTDHLDALLADAHALESSTWQGADGLAMSSQRTTSRFFWEVARWAASEGILRLTFLRVGGRSVAFAYDLESDGVRYGLRTGYDQALARFGPGMVLHADLVAAAFADGIESYELLGACDPWKLVWATGERDQARVQLYARTPRAIGQQAVSTALSRSRVLASRHLPAPVARKALSLSRRWADRGRREDGFADDGHSVR